MIPLGILGTLSGGAAAGAYELISTAYGTGSSGTITFSSIPSTYKHLEVRIVGRNSDTGGTQGNLRMRLNGATTGYAWHELSGNASSVTSIASSATTQMYMGALPTNAQTNESGAAIVSILDYASSSKNKTIKSLFGVKATDASVVGLSSGLLVSTTAVSSVSLITSGSFLTSTRISLYGILG